MNNHPLMCIAYNDINTAKSVYLLTTTGRRPFRILDIPTHYTFDSTYPEKINFYDFIKNMALAGSVNGIVCLSHSREMKYRFVALWNPTISLWKPIPLPVSHFRHDVIKGMSVGLGYDKVGDDYIIVRIVPVCPPHFKEYTWSRLEIYSAKTDSWKDLATDKFIPFWPKLPNCNFIVDGVPYWTGVDEFPEDLNNPYRQEMLGCIDPRTGLFKKVPYPEHVMNERTWVHPVKLKDSVATLIQYPGEGCHQIMVDLYELDENAANWTKKKIIGPLPLSELWIPQCFDTEEIVLETWERDISDAVRFPFFCDPATGFVRRPNRALDALQLIWHESYSHVESLVSVGGMIRIRSEKKERTTSKEMTDSEKKMWAEVLPKVFETVLNLDMGQAVMSPLEKLGRDK